ncbi:MAG TPA: hypothetical protein GXZ27_09245 [Thermoanaerobacterales bacterium]|nr:hypothetical protein [Thermoanaerobacterales bacterium]
MKRILILITTVLLILTLVACAAKQSEPPAGSQQTGSNEDVSSGEKNDKGDSQNENTKKSGSAKPIDIEKANTGIINENKIPEGYRKDLVPIVPGSEIYGEPEPVIGDKEPSQFHLTCLSEEKMENIVEFYKAVLENAEGKREITPDPNGCFLEGILDNVFYTILIKKEFGKESGGSFDKKYKTSIFIDLQICTDEEIKQLKQDSN